MKFFYFDVTHKLNNYSFNPIKEFNCGVEVDTIEIVYIDDDRYDFYHTDNVQEAYVKIVAWCVETYGYDPDRYESLLNLELDRFRIYFRDVEDQAAFKLVWGFSN